MCICAIKKPSCERPISYLVKGLSVGENKEKENVLYYICATNKYIYNIYMRYVYNCLHCINIFFNVQYVREGYYED